VLRTVEYPDGELRTIKIHRMSRPRLQALIAELQPPPFPTAYVRPADVKQISVFTAPHFTEPVMTDGDVSGIPDNAWLMWSKESYEEEPIPTKNVKLDGSHVKQAGASPKAVATLSDIVLQDRAISAARRIVASSRRAGGEDGAMTRARLSQSQHDRVVDLAVDRDAGLLTVARNFGDDDEEFGRHVKRLLLRRDPQAILLADGGPADDGRGNDQGEEGYTSDRKVAQPQVELAGRD
jgi:hypothetical protein